MKKLLLTFLIALFTTSFVIAQTTTYNEGNEFTGFSQGNFILTGGISFNTIKNGNIESTTFSITPKGGYFVSDNVIVGIQVQFSSTRRENVSDFGFQDTKITTIAPGAFSRYYFTPEKKFSFFTELTLNYINTKTEMDESGVIIIDPFNPTPTSSQFDFKSDGFSVKLAPGINYFISDSFALEATIGIVSYSSINNALPNTNSSDSFAVALNLSNINLGLIYRF